MKWNKKTTISIALACLLFIFVFWYILHISFQQSISQVNLERQKLFQISDNIQEYNGKYGNLDDYMFDLEELYQSASDTLPDQMQQGQFINLMQQIALDNQVKVISLDLSDIQPLNKETNESADELALNKLPIVVKVESSYNSLINFLKAIEDSERLVQIDNFSMASKGTEEDLICKLELTIFSLEQ